MRADDLPGFRTALNQRNSAALVVEASLGLVLVPAFWALDWVVMPQHVHLLFWIRAVPTFAAACILLAYRLRPRLLEAYGPLLSFGFSWLVAASISLMCFLHDGYESPYYAGINLVVMAVGLIYSWSLRVSVVFTGLVYVTHMLPLVLGLVPVRDLAETLTNQFFLVAVAIITVVSQTLRRRLELREFAARMEQHRLMAELESLATIDALTGIWNRRQFLRLGADEVLRSQRYRHALSVLLLDIDRFKSINDTHGHPVGDEVIRAVTQRLLAALRTTDIAGRYGGEEFSVILPETEARFAAEVVGERLRSAVCAAPVSTTAGPIPVTISIGVTGVSLGAETLAEAIERADIALYAAKNGGRNRVVLRLAPGAPDEVAQAGP